MGGDWKVAGLCQRTLTLKGTDIDKAVEDLEGRPHEVKSWAASGVKQDHITKDLASKVKEENESLVKAQASVGDLQESDFEHVERALHFAHSA